MALFFFFFLLGWRWASHCGLPFAAPLLHGAPLTGEASPGVQFLAAYKTKMFRDHVRKELAKDHGNLLSLPPSLDCRENIPARHGVTLRALKNEKAFLQMPRDSEIPDKKAS